jgi:diguanylate cyclase (GGDEF)-like protein
MKYPAQILIVVLFALQMHSTSYAASPAAKKGKVLVSQFSEFNEITEHIPDFSNTADVSDYVQNPNNVDNQLKLKVLAQFSDQKSNLSANEINKLALLKAYVFVKLRDNSVLSQLELVNVNLLSAQDTMLYHLLSADAYAKTHQLFQMEKALKQAFELAQGNQDTKQLNEISFRLANLYLDIEYVEQAQNWLNKVKFSFEQNDNLAIWLETAVQLASTHNKLGNLNRSENILSNVISTLKQQNLISLVANIEFQLVQVYLKQGQLDKAQAVLEQRFVYAQKTRDYQQQMQAMTGLMEIALEQQTPWQADKILTQANKLEGYIQDLKTKMAFWQVKAHVLVKKSQYRAALDVLSKYEKHVLSQPNLAMESGLRILADKHAWLTSSGQLNQSQSTFAAYQELANRVAKLTANRKINFIQQNYIADKQKYQQAKVEDANQIQGLKQETEQQDKRIMALYIVIILLILAAAMSMWWLYKKFKFDHAQASLIDPMTQAYNHRFLTRQFTYLKHHKHKVSLILFNLDKVSELNKRLGHEITDHVMFQLVQKLKQRLVKNTWLIRESGDRFAVLANNFDHKQAFILAEILRKELNSQEFQFGQNRVKLRASFAAAECKAEEDLESMKLRLALGLEQAKLQGGDKTWQS